MVFSFISLALVILLLILVRIAFPGLLGRSGPEYARRESLFTAAEFRFLQVLRKAVPDGLEIFAKVRVADVIQPVEGLDPKAWRAAFHKITAKHFDFVLCDRETGQIACAIELNDRSHERKERLERDKLIARACAEAGLPLVTVPVARDYDLEALCDGLRIALGTYPIPPGSAEPASREALCPRCGGDLTRKIARRGPRKGSTFLACSGYPDCRYTTEAID